MPEVGDFVFPFLACPAQGPLLIHTAEEFLFPDQIKVNHAGPVMKAMLGVICCEVILWLLARMWKSSVYVISQGEHPPEVEYITTCCLFS